MAQNQDFGGFRVYWGTPATFSALACYPDLPNPVAPRNNPALPSSFDPFDPPVSSSVPAAGVPIIAEYTQSANPGDSLVLTGSNLSSYTGTALGSDTSFVTFGENATALATAYATIPAIEAEQRHAHPRRFHARGQRLFALGGQQPGL